MTEIERKALALAIEVRADDKYRVCKEPTVYFALWEALCRAIEQHEAFRQEVSDAVEVSLRLTQGFEGTDAFKAKVILERFIIAKPDPLVAAIREMALTDATCEDADRLRAALAARGLEIREKQT